MAESSNQVCQQCRILTLDKVSNAPSCAIKGGYGYPDKEQDEKDLALGLKTPIFFSLGHILANCSSCGICGLLHQQLDETLYVDNAVLEAYLWRELDNSLNSLRFYIQGSSEKVARLDLYGVEGSPNDRIFKHRPISISGSDESISRIREWVKHCTASHPRCQLDISGSCVLMPTKLPTRVIDVGAFDKDVKLSISNGESATYVALSHCWGGASLTRTTKSLLQEHQHCIRHDNLSKTIQDAVRITRNLGVRYLWVDSLCILQDDEKDWEFEVKTMALVYEGACFTIAATAVKDGTEGLFSPRPPQSLVEIPCNPMDTSSGSMLFGVKDQTAISEMFKGPLNNRAWVLQERLFSRRTIHFARDQMYRECDKGLLAEDNDCEEDPSVEPFTIDFLPSRSMLCYVLDSYLSKHRNPLPKGAAIDEDSFGTIADFHSLWARNIKFFSRCGLTNASDKLPALHSLSEKLTELTGHPYHEGHWFDGSNLSLTALLWCAAKGASLKKVTSARAPSWSWASLEGPLKYLDFREWWVDIFYAQELDMKILRVTNFKPLKGQITKSLMLEAANIPCSMCTCSGNLSHRVRPPEAPTNLEFDRVVSERGELIRGNFEFDLKEDQPHRFWILPVYVHFFKKTKLVWLVLLVLEVPF